MSEGGYFGQRSRGGTEFSSASVWACETWYLAEMMGWPRPPGLQPPLWRVNSATIRDGEQTDHPAAYGSSTWPPGPPN